MQPFLTPGICDHSIVPTCSILSSLSRGISNGHLAYNCCFVAGSLTQLMSVNVLNHIMSCPAQDCLFPSRPPARHALPTAVTTVTGEEPPNSVFGAEAQRQVWVVGVEDFMRRFLPGRSNAKSIFALAQLNGIVKYACHKVNTKCSRYV